MTKEALLAAYLVENQDRFYRLAYSLLHSREEALDAVQAAACRSRTVPFPETGPEPAWEDPEPPDETLARRVDALPAGVSTVIKLRFYEELTLKEIGEVTGQNLNTVKSRLYAGLKKLRVAMEGAEI